LRSIYTSFIRIICQHQSGRSIWFFLARAFSLPKAPLTRVGFPWTSSSGSSLFNGLHGKIDGNIFERLFSMVRGIMADIEALGLRISRTIHPKSLL
jgi:hypothetical protein